MKQRIFQNLLENHQLMLHRKLTSLTRSNRRNPRGEKKPVKIMEQQQQQQTTSRNLRTVTRNYETIELRATVGLFIYYSNRTKKHMES